MAKLLSEDDEVKTSIELVLLKDEVENKLNISWVSYKLILKSGEEKLLYERKKNNQGAGDYVLALKPVNEIENIVNGIDNFLEHETKTIFSFEPLEPSFELIMERSHNGYSVTCWADAGNVVSNHYSWDGFGLRFFTSKEKIVSFVNELTKEGKDLFLKDHA